VETRRVYLDEHLKDVASEALAELIRATELHAPMHSPHEGLAVIWEEFEELKEHVWQDAGRSSGAREEALQLAAMAMRYVLDLSEVAQ
jgi:hypothetical protein